MALPETVAAEDGFAFSVLNKGKPKGMVWAWMERVEPSKPRVPRSNVVAVRVASQADKQLLLAAGGPTRTSPNPITTAFPRCWSASRPSTLTSWRS